MRHAPTLGQLPARVTKIEDEFSLAVIEGLSAPQKTLPCRYFYDARGSELFEEITRLPEYYPTRTEARILEESAAEIASGFSDGDLLVEFGSGSSLKTEILLNRISARIVYVPIDVSESALVEATARLAERHPNLDVRPFAADFSDVEALPFEPSDHRRTGFFPGSTIGNFAPRDAAHLLSNFKSALGTGGRLIIGVDLKKDPHTLVRAYDDDAGITAAFNLNLLTRINRELGGTFDVNSFRHRAVYNPREGRIEMHLVSLGAQNVKACGRLFHFREGESIHTENSYKYTVAEFQELARVAGWSPRRVWTDGDNRFSVHELL